MAAERARIARELHDVVGHGLSVVVLQLVAAQGMLENGDQHAASQRLVATERSAREALAEMRRLLGLLDEEDASLAPQPGLRDDCAHHLLGFDHETPVEARRMEGLETVVLAGLGVVDPYREIVRPARARHG